jgi:hypothetical protein
MPTRKEEKERRRKERLEAERRAAADARRRLMLGYVAAGLLAAAVVAGIVVALLGSGGDGQKIESGDVPGESHVDLQSGRPPEGVAFDDRAGTPPPALAQADLEIAAEEAGCELHLGLPDEGNTHLRPGDKPPNYGTSPPTSGDHDPSPAADGAYLDPIEPVNFVHSLEHGRVAILYDPKLPEEDQLALKGLFDEDPNGMLLFPYPDMPYEVAVGSWTNYVGCDSYGEGFLDVIRDFRDQFRGNGPEPVPL